MKTLSLAGLDRRESKRAAGLLHTLSNWFAGLPLQKQSRLVEVGPIVLPVDLTVMKALVSASPTLTLLTLNCTCLPMASRW